jgi:predicted RNA binding protein YcfA (HicA-like mRNA interferase family)
MASISKIVKEMLSDPKEMRDSPIIKVVEFFGFQRKKHKTGSHFVFIKDKEIIVMPCHSHRVKREYIKNIVDKLNLEEWYASTDK